MKGAWSTLYILEQTVQSAVARLVDTSRSLTSYPREEFWRDFNSDLVSAVGSCLDQGELKVVPFSTLRHELDDLRDTAAAKLREVAVVTTDKELASVRGYPCFELNRLIEAAAEPWYEWENYQDESCDGYGEIIGIGPRPGSHNLDKQLAKIKSLVGESPVIIVEDGAFSGGTLRAMITMMRESKINVNAIVLGFLFPKAAGVLQELNGEINHTFWMGPAELKDGDEWVLDQDFFPFLPGSGRVVGYRLQGRVRPIYSLNGFHLARPYIFPFGNPTKWASIPFEHGAGFSKHCIELAIELFRHLGEVNEKQIILSDLSNTYPCTGIPVAANLIDFPDINVPVVNLLLEYRNSAMFEESHRQFAGESLHQEP